MAIPFSVSWVQELIRAIFDPEAVDLLDLSKEVSPGIVLEMDRREWSFLKREFHYAGSRSQAAVPGELAAVGIYNRGVPTVGSSDYLAMVYMIKNTSPTLAADLIIGLTTGGAVNVPGQVSSAPVAAAFDTRMIPDPTTAARGQSAIFSASSVAGIGGGVFSLSDSLIAGERISKEKDGCLVVLAPGGYVGLQGQGLNAAMSGNFWLYERSTRAKGRYIV